MYTKDGKPIPIPYGRKVASVGTQELDELRQEIESLKARIEALEQPGVASVEAEAESFDELKSRAEALGIEVKGNWGVNRIKKAIEEAGGNE